MATQTQLSVGWKRGTIWALPLMLALSFALNWPYLGSGFLADEVVILSAMEQDPLPYSRWRGAWSGDVTDLSWFGSPWWAEPGAMGSFFRPLPTLVWEGSLRLFGRVAFPLHLGAVVLHGLIAFLLVLVLIPLSGSRAPPVLAGVVWLACEDHSMTVGFPSFATDIMCVLFMMIALLAHLAWLRSRRPAHMMAALMAVAAALASKETAAVAPVVLIVTSFFFPKGRRAHGAGSEVRSGGVGGEEEEDLVDWAWIRSRAAGLWRDPWSWAPWVAVLVVFLGLYAGLGLGGMDSLTYIDPVKRPGRYLAHLVVHLPVMWLATLSVVPPSLGFLDPATFVPMAVAGAVAFPLFLLVLGARLRRPLVLWGLALYTLSLLPQLGTDAGERGLYLPLTFLAVVLVIPMLDVGPLARRLAPHAGALSAGVSRWRAAGGWYLLVGVALTGFAMSAYMPFVYVEWGRPAVEDPLTAAPYVEVQHETLIFLTTRDSFSLIMLPTILREAVAHDVDVRIVSAASARAVVERVDDASFVLRLDRPGWLTSFLPAAFRTDPVVQVGRRYPGDLFDVTVLEVTDDGRDVLAVEVTMHGTLHDPGTLFLFWDRAGYKLLDFDDLEEGAAYPLDVEGAEEGAPDPLGGAAEGEG